MPRLKAGAVVADEAMPAELTGWAADAVVWPGVADVLGGAPNERIGVLADDNG